MRLILCRSSDELMCVTVWLLLILCWPFMLKLALEVVNADVHVHLTGSQCNWTEQCMTMDALLIAVQLAAASSNVYERPPSLTCQSHHASFQARIPILPPTYTCSRLLHCKHKP